MDTYKYTGLDYFNIVGGFFYLIIIIIETMIFIDSPESFHEQSFIIKWVLPILIARYTSEYAKNEKFRNQILWFFIALIFPGLAQIIIGFKKP
jgi:hypothetical protein